MMTLKDPQGMVSEFEPFLEAMTVDNVAAVTGANRLMELFKLGLGFRISVAQVARSWAVTEEEGAAAKVPRCGFSVAQLLSNGFFTVLTFDAPAPQLLTAGDAIALSGRGLGQYRDERGALRLHEYIGRLEAGQTLLLPSDDLIRAGFSSEADKGYVAGGEALAQYFSRQLDRETRPAPRQMLEERFGGLSAPYLCIDDTLDHLEKYQAEGLRAVHISSLLLLAELK